MFKNFRVITLAALLTLTAGACGEEALGPDDQENEDGEWGAAQQTALLSALTTSGVFAASPVAAFAPMVVATLSDVGTISASQVAAISQAVESGIQMARSATLSSTYNGAFGIQVGYEVDGIEGWFVGVLGWNGINAETSSVTQLISVYHADTGSNEPPATHSATIGLDDALQHTPPSGAANHHLAVGTYWNGTDTFWGTNGAMDFTASSFSGSNDCGQVSFSCTYSTGSMSGSFDFDAQTLIGGMSWSQVPVSFSSLPAVKLMISQGL